MNHTMPVPRGRTRRATTTALAAVAVFVMLGASACGSSSGSAKAATTTAAPTTAAASPTTAAAAGGSATSTPKTGGGDTQLTASIATVPKVGAVLVNQDGDTLYILSSEKGGKITCTDASGCTKAWPDTELPDGATSAQAGTGVNAALLGTAKGSDGDAYVTYGGYPLYTFAGDGGPGKANGEGIKSFGGTWYAIDAAGKPVDDD